MTQPDQKFLQAIERLCKDKQPVQVEMSKHELWCILSTIQLACRHPHFDGPTRKIVEQIARQLGKVIVANDTDLRMLFEMGWQSKFDEPQKA